MSLISTCKYNSITLNQGETFVLPTGAEIVGISNEGAVTSECEIGTVEQLDCYVIVVPVAHDGTNAENLSQIRIEGVVFNGTKYPFGTPLNINAATSENVFKDSINQALGNISSVNGLLLDRCFQKEMSSSDYGAAFYISYKSIPSIGTTLSFYGRDVQNKLHPGGFSHIPMLFPSTQRDELIAMTTADSANMLENCPCNI